MEEIQDMREIAHLSEREIQQLARKKLGKHFPKIEYIKERMGKFNPALFVLTDIVDYSQDQFDLFLIEDCDHFSQINKNQYTNIMRQI